MSDSAGMHHGCPDIVNELFLNELLTIIDAVENFSSSQRSGRMLANNPKALLYFSRRGIFEPEQMRGFQFLAQSRSFDWCQAMMRIVQKVQMRPEFFSQSHKKLRNEIQIMFRRPLVLRRRIFFGGFI